MHVDINGFGSFYIQTSACTRVQVYIHAHVALVYYKQDVGTRIRFITPLNLTHQTKAKA